jgi:hypothetical protein
MAPLGKQSDCGDAVVKKEAKELQGKPDMQMQGALALALRLAYFCDEGTLGP